MTSPARTVLDIAPRLNERELPRAVNQARHRLYMGLGELNELLERLPNHPETARLLPFAEIRTGPNGYACHGDGCTFERDAATLAAGYGTVRVTWDGLNGATDLEVARLLAILRACRAA